jgi:hypothetical protein
VVTTLVRAGKYPDGTRCSRKDRHDH